LTTLLALLIAGQHPVTAQPGSGGVPETATANRYTDGWICNLGYVKVDAACTAR